MNDSTWLWLAGAAALVWYLTTQQSGGAASGTGIPVYSTQAAPLSIYPEFAYTAVTSTASSPTQQAPTASGAATVEGLYAASQNAAQAAMMAQCAGSYPGCSPMMGDTQLGL